MGTSASAPVKRRGDEATSKRTCFDADSCEASAPVTGTTSTCPPIIAASDYVRAVSESIRAFIPEGRRYLTLGTDGFGRSDTRSELRAFFQVDAASIAKAARFALGLKQV